MKLPASVWQYGSEQALPTGQWLQAGPLSVWYEHGFLRYLKVGETEVLRMLYFAVRDHNWDTMPGVISEEKIEVKEGEFLIRYVWTSTATHVPFRWDCRIQGFAEGRVEMEIEGEALGDFRRNRVGFCVLHPVQECAGQPCEVERVDGSKEQATFPQRISPHQPMKDLRALTWWPAEGQTAHLLMEGDTFEMEDQRNWTDDSYKTYCTPLERPFPVALQTGDRVWQQLSLRCQVDEAAPDQESEGIVLQFDEENVRRGLPKLGLEQSSEYGSLGQEEAAVFANMGLHHLRAEVHLDQADWHNQVQAAQAEAKLLGVEVEWVLFFGEFSPELGEAIASQLAGSQGSVLVLSSLHKVPPASLLAEALPILRQHLPAARIGAGTNAYFTELNRERIEPTGLDFLSYSLNPQVHGFDLKSLTETLAAQAYTVESAQAFAREAKVHISPLTLKPRFNPNATGPPAPTPPGALPDAVDPRQMSLYAAAWTLGSLSHLAFSGADQLTYFETIGWRGMMQGEREPEASPFPRERGMLFPLWQVFRLVLAHQSAHWWPVESSDSLAVKGMGWDTKGQRHLLLANLTEQDQPVQFPWRMDKSVRVKTLDVSTVEAATQQLDFWERTASQSVSRSLNKSLHLTLSPFSVHWIFETPDAS
ncbi:MAG: hypothetical protein AAF399_14370 [Bacteroidota bacterium]